MELAGTKILVTGAAGFIGSHLADRLAERSELTLVDDFSVGPRENLAGLEAHPNVRIVEADIRSQRRMHQLMRRIDVVYHLAISDLRTSIGRPGLSHTVNAGGTLSVLLAARARAVRRFVYVSSSEVYGSAQSVPMAESHPLDPTTVYGASKLAGELYARAFQRTYGLPVCVVRPFNTYGPREPYAGLRAEVIPRFILQLAAGLAPVIYGDGSQTRDFNFVDDTVAGLLLAGACDEGVGDVVNLGSGRETSVRRIAELLASSTGAETAPLTAAPRPGDVDRHCADIGKARRLFGFAPKTDLETGLARTLAWFQSNEIASRVPAGAAGLPNW